MMNVIRNLLLAGLVIALAGSACGNETSTEGSNGSEGKRVAQAADHEPSPSPTGGQAQCDDTPVQPTYLPWLEGGEDVPPARETYDESIDRFQQSWQDPRFEPGKGGIALTIYPVERDTGEEVSHGGGNSGVVVEGAEGRIHHGEGGSVSMSWTLGSRRCNFLELLIANPKLGQQGLEKDLLRVARSLE